MIFKSFRKRASGTNTSVVNTLQLYFASHDFILKNKLWRYLLFSGLVFILLFAFTIKLIMRGVDAAEAPLTAWLLENVKSFITLETDTLKNILTGGFWLVRQVITSNQDTIFLFLFLIIGTPYFSFISARTERIMTGKSYPFSFRQFRQELRRGLRIALRNSFMQFLVLLLITLIAFVPFVSIITPLLKFIVMAYYNGILITDYSLERRGISVPDSRRYFKQHKTALFALGLGFMFLLLIPVIGWFLAPTYGLVAAAMYVVQVSKVESKRDNKTAGE